GGRERRTTRRRSSVGLFLRNASKKASDEAREPATAEAAGPAAEEAAAPDRPECGPFDSSQVTGMGPRVDLGAIWLPVLPGLELRMEVDKKTLKVTGESATLAGFGLQVQAIAAPRTEGILDEVRAEIGESITRQGGTV